MESLITSSDLKTSTKTIYPSEPPGPITIFKERLAKKIKDVNSFNTYINNTE